MENRADLDQLTSQKPGDPELHCFQNWIYRGSYMSAHVLLNLLNELGKSDEMRGLQSILSLFAMSLLNSIIQDSFLSNDIKITLKSHFWHEKL